MEPNKTKKLVILIPIVLAAAIALAVGISVIQKNRPAPTTPGASLSSLLSKDVRMLKLDIRFKE
ncbi:MAG: hypothetical protein HC887_09495 [Desulfobacteraceae bacterium]|nr:hypothetical protein [Desulfobacteraceae bacterium]